MIKLPAQAWILVDKEGNVQGMDTNSGGCQYNAFGLGGIRYWETLALAMTYLNIIDYKHDKGYRVIPVTLTEKII